MGGLDLVGFGVDLVGDLYGDLVGGGFCGSSDLRGSWGLGFADGEDDVAGD